MGASACKMSTGNSAQVTYETGFTPPRCTPECAAPVRAAESVLRRNRTVPAAYLQRDRSARELGVLGLCRQRAVQFDRQLRSFRGDLRVPFPTGVDDRQRFGDVDDRAGPSHWSGRLSKTFAS